MKHLRLFDTNSEYIAEKENIVKPWCSLVKESNATYYGNKNETTLVNYVYLSYGYSLDEWNDGTRLDYVDEYEYEGKTYSRFVYSYINEESGERETMGYDDMGFVLFENRNFTRLTFPYSIEVLQGHIWDEGEADIYPFVNDWPNIELYGFAEEQTNMIVIQHRTDIGTNANGHTYVDLGLTSGTLWATMNVGAESATEYGGYFQWGDTVDKSDAVCKWETYKYSNDDGTEFSKYNTGLDNVGGTIDNKITLDLSDDAARANMGGDWKMPSLAQMDELVQETNNVWVENYNGSGVNGWLFTSKTNGNSIFIPASGSRWDSSFYDQGSNACVWSSSLYASYPNNAMNLYFYSVSIYASLNIYRGYGFCVRGVL